MKLPIKTSVFAFFFCFFIAHSQQNQPKSTRNTIQKPNYQAALLQENPQVDGEVINDPVWQMVPAIKDLVQIRPNYGAAV